MRAHRSGGNTYEFGPGRRLDIANHRERSRHYVASVRVGLPVGTGDHPVVVGDVPAAGGGTSRP